MLIGRNVKRGWRLDTIPRRYCRSGPPKSERSGSQKLAVGSRGRLIDKERAGLLNRQSQAERCSSPRRSMTRLIIQPLARPRILDRTVVDDHDALVAHCLTGFS